MNIQLGNLSTNEICSRLGISLSDEDVAKLESLRSLRADTPKGKWHGFDIPFSIYCGDMETAVIVRDIYLPHAAEMTGRLAIKFDQPKEGDQ